MDDMFWRLLWLIAAVTLITYATFLFFGSILRDEPLRAPILVTDRVGDGTHHLTGTIPVSSSCHQVSVQVRETESFRYHIDFVTWYEPFRTDCAKDSAHTFYALVFAPALGVEFSASIDEKPLELEINKIYLKE